MSAVTHKPKRPEVARYQPPVGAAEKRKAEKPRPDNETQPSGETHLSSGLDKPKDSRIIQQTISEPPKPPTVKQLSNPPSNSRASPRTGPPAKQEQKPTTQYYEEFDESNWDRHFVDKVSKPSQNQPSRCNNGRPSNQQRSSMPREDSGYVNRSERNIRRNDSASSHTLPKANVQQQKFAEQSSSSRDKSGWNNSSRRGNQNVPTGESGSDREWAAHSPAIEVFAKPDSHQSQHTDLPSNVVRTQQRQQQQRSVPGAKSRFDPPPRFERSRDQWESQSYRDIPRQGRSQIMPLSSDHPVSNRRQSYDELARPERCPSHGSTASATKKKRKNHKKKKPKVDSSEISDSDLPENMTFTSAKAHTEETGDWKADYQEYRRSSAKPNRNVPQTTRGNFARYEPQQDVRQVDVRLVQNRTGRPQTPKTIKVQSPSTENKPYPSTPSSGRLSPIRDNDWSLEVEESERKILQRSAEEETPPPDPSSRSVRSRATSVLLPQDVSTYDKPVRPLTNTIDARWMQPQNPTANIVPPQQYSENYQTSSIYVQRNHTPGMIHLPANMPITSEVPHNRDMSSKAQLMSAIERMEWQVHQCTHQFHTIGSVKMDYLLTMKTNLQNMYREFLLSSQEQSQYDANLWKTCFYEIIEALRNAIDLNNMDNPPQANKYRSVLTKFLEDATVFYQDLILAHEETYGVTLSDFMYPLDDMLTKAVTVKRSPRQRAAKLAMLSCQRFLMALGDLARYKEMLMKTNNFGRSRIAYIKAFQLSPKNGWPLHQLGLLAIYTHRRLDAVYFLVRSLAASSPYANARQSLTQVFEEVKRKYDQCENELRCELEYARREAGITESNYRCKPKHRVEIWYRLDGSSDTTESGNVETVTETDIICQAKTDILHRRFVAYFLHLAGTLINKINMEAFDTIAEKGLVHFRELLSRPQSPLTPMELVQIVTVCLYSVYNAAQSASRAEAGTHSLQQQNALQLIFSVFGLLLEHVRYLFTNDVLASKTINARIHLVLPALRVLSNWMMLSRKYYQDVVNSFDGVQSQSFQLNIWSDLVALCNTLCDVDCAGERIQVKEVPANEDASSASGLTASFMMPEDVLLANFTDCFVAANTCRTTSTIDLDLACEHHRLDVISELCDFLEGVKFPHIAFDDERRCFVSPSQSSDISFDSQIAPAVKNLSMHDRSSDALLSSSSSSTAADNNPFQEKRRAEDAKQKILDEVGSSGGVRVEVSPMYLIPDTNAFIDHLPEIRRILESEKYQVVVPSTVMVELVGLQKRRDSEWVPKMATETLTYLHAKSDGGCRKLKGITAKGNLVDQLKFMQENTQDAMTPDDRILNCCDLLEQSRQQSTPSVNLKYEALKLSRSVVLLTDDRNLRVKALGRNLVVQTVPAFIKWAFRL